MGQTYPADEIAGWLVGTGFTNVGTQMLRRTPSSGLVTALKTG